jgi:DNA repair exonuclease SbcCD nuclease subunit
MTRIAHLSDTHLGYAAKCRTNKNGVNERVLDGLRGFRDSVTAIIEEQPDVVVHGGDLFHRSAPGVGEIAFARGQLERFAAAGIPVIGVTGNHDFATDRGKSNATAAVHDPTRNINMVVGADQVFRPEDGLNIHVVSHAGLIGADRPEPALTDGDVNILASHGAAQVPGSAVFSCVDSPGEAVVSYDLLTLPWSIVLLGHYHKRGPIAGFNKGDGQVWYAGSLLRRGFSDPPGGRGWLLVTVNSDGSTTVEERNIAQRPQFDLEEIDASGLTGHDVEERIRENLAQIDFAGGPILRQRVRNCPVAVRRGVNAAALKDLTSDALVWQLEFFRPPLPELEFADASGGNLATAGGTDLPASWATWFPEYADSQGIPDQERPGVLSAGADLLRDVSHDTETNTETNTETSNTPNDGEVSE